jgi:hypothetical protein
MELSNEITCYGIMSDRFEFLFLESYIMNKVARLILTTQILVYHILLVIGMYAMRSTEGPVRNSTGKVLGYGVISMVALIVLSVIVMGSTGTFRISGWSITAFIGIVLILAAPSTLGFYINESRNGPSENFKIEDVYAAASTLLSFGLILYVLAIMGGNLYKTEFRNGLAIFMAVAWVLTILAKVWGSAFIEVDKQVPILTLALFGTVTLAFTKPTAKNLPDRLAKEEGSDAPLIVDIP